MGIKAKVIALYDAEEALAQAENARDVAVGGHQWDKAKDAQIAVNRAKVALAEARAALRKAVGR